MFFKVKNEFIFSFLQKYYETPIINATKGDSANIFLSDVSVTLVSNNLNN